jgi:DNA-directed RNA polymerase subunit E'/Rpb7
MSARSCFFEQVVSERLTVPPDYISGITNHVLLFLNRRLLVCTGKFHEVLVSYKDVKLVQTAGAIVDEQPYVQAHIRYTATIFRPTLGAVLEVSYLLYVYLSVHSDLCM